MYKSILLLITGCCFITHLQAQWPVIPSPSVVNSTGGTINLLNNAGFVEFSVGEMAITSLNIGGNAVGFTQGFLQPRLAAPFIINTHDAFDEMYGFKCYPNPVSDFLITETEYKDFNGLQFINVEGQIIQETLFDYSPVDCSSLPAGTYFVRLFSKNKPESKTFKLFKK